jgi:glycosyl transferase family 25
MKTYIISLEREKARREKISNNLEQYPDIDYEFVDALDARKYTLEEIDSFVWVPRREWRNYLRPGAVCCALSHMIAYKKFLDFGGDWCLVLEDDVFVVPSRYNSFMKLVQDLKTLDYDLILLNSYANKKVDLYRDNSYKELHSCYKKFPQSGAAYLINKSAAKNIIRNNNPVMCTADQWGELIVPPLKMGIIKPDIFHLTNAKSSIDYVRDSGINAFVPESMKSIRRMLLYRVRLKNIHIYE